MDRLREAAYGEMLEQADLCRQRGELVKGNVQVAEVHQPADLHGKLRELVEGEH
jgi:hypothetical protein